MQILTIPLLILFIIPTEYLIAHYPDDLRFIIISIENYYLPTLKITVEIVMFKHSKDEYPVINQISRCSVANFHVLAHNRQNLIQKRFAIMRYLLDMYPNALLCYEMIAWNASRRHSVVRDRQQVINRLWQNPIFNNSILYGYEINDELMNPSLREMIRRKVPPVFMYLPFIGKNLKSSLVTWGFHATIKASAFCLRRKIMNLVSKICMNKVLADTNNEIDYFNRTHTNFLTSNALLSNSNANLSFFNVIMIMSPNKIAPFRTRYHANLQQLPIPEVYVKELEDYCPADEHIYYNFGRVLI